MHAIIQICGIKLKPKLIKYWTTIAQLPKTLTRKWLHNKSRNVTFMSHALNLDRNCTLPPTLHILNNRSCAIVFKYHNFLKTFKCCNYKVKIVVQNLASCFTAFFDVKIDHFIALKLHLVINDTYSHCICWQN